MMKFFAVCLLFTLSCTFAFASNPGFVTTISQSAIDTVLAATIPILQTKVSSLTIPDFHDNIETPIGHVMLDITQIDLSRFTFGTAVAKFLPGTGISLTISASTAHINFNWHWKEHSFPKASDHGSGECSMSNAVVTANIAVGESAGRPSITCTSDSCNIGDLDIKLHGGASWLYNEILHEFKDHIRHEVEKGIKNAVSKQINELAAKYMATIPTKLQTGKSAYVDFQMTSAATFTSSYVSVPFKGEFYNLTDPVEYPHDASVMPQTVGAPRMLEIFFNQYVADSAGWVYYKNGDMNIEISKLPKLAPVQLNTKDWQVYLPKLYDFCPDCPMELKIHASHAPKLVVSKKYGLNFTVHGDVDIMVNRTGPHHKQVLATTLGGIVKATGEAKLNATAVSGSLTYLGSNISMKYSAFGDYSVQAVQEILDFICKYVVLPIFNEAGETGMVLPFVKGVTVVNPVLTYLDSYAVVTTDMKFDPNQW